MPYFHFCLCQFSTDCNNAVNSNGYVMATARSENEMWKMKKTNTFHTFQNSLGNTKEMLRINTAEWFFFVVADSIAIAVADASFFYSLLLLFCSTLVGIIFYCTYVICHFVSFYRWMRQFSFFLRAAVFILLGNLFALLAIFTMHSHSLSCITQMNILSEFTSRISQYLCTICEMKKKQISFRMQLANEMTRRFYRVFPGKILPFSLSYFVSTT